MFDGILSVSEASELFIDGKAVSSTWTKTAELELATLIEPGMHTIRIVQEILGCTREVAEARLEANEWNIRKAVS